MHRFPGNFAIKVHPGDVLREMLDEIHLSQAELARHLNVDPSKINEICRRKRGISAEMAVLLGRAFNVSPGTWLNLQKNWELSQVKPSVAKRTKPLAILAGRG
ncbi:MAG: HigA family addiction module antidote protein [Candidatus Hydrogenedentes bacterium]|nr:HigA family addiction module antidote protein [Candidatus Hydrogenedentota bacterium]